MTQKKRPMCTMANEHREYFVQSMPLERMNCVGKNLGHSSLSRSNGSEQLQSNMLSLCTVAIVCMISMIQMIFFQKINRQKKGNENMDLIEILYITVKKKQIFYAIFNFVEKKNEKLNANLFIYQKIKKKKKKQNVKIIIKYHLNEK